MTLKCNEINTQWIYMTKECPISSGAKKPWFGEKTLFANKQKQNNIYKKETARENTLFESIFSLLKTKTQLAREISRKTL